MKFWATFQGERVLIFWSPSSLDANLISWKIPSKIPTSLMDLDDHQGSPTWLRTPPYRQPVSGPKKPAAQKNPGRTQRTREPSEALEPPAWPEIEKKNGTNWRNLGDDFGADWILKKHGRGVHVCSTRKNGQKLSLQVPATGRFPSKTVDFTNEIWDMCYQIGDLPKSYGFQKCGTPKYHTS